MGGGCCPVEWKGRSRCPRPEGEAARHPEPQARRPGRRQGHGHRPQSSCWVGLGEAPRPRPQQPQGRLAKWILMPALLLEAGGWTPDPVTMPLFIMREMSKMSAMSVCARVPA